MPLQLPTPRAMFASRLNAVIRRRPFRWNGCVFVLLLLLFLPAGAAWAQETFTVTTADEYNVNAFTLRNAIEAANANQNPEAVDVIAFDLSGTPPFTLLLEETTLPPITEPVRIDATTQPGYDGTPAFVIDGSGIPGDLNHGLTLTFGSNGSEIRGLAIINFSGIGIMVRSDSNSIGGTIAEGGNVIAGNGGTGIELYYANNNRLTGNYIGTDPSGATGEGNGGAGVALVFGSSDNEIGGTTAGARNVISGNGEHGISLTGGDGNPIGNTIAGNYIGTDASGTEPLPNARSGIFIDMAANTSIGGTEEGAANRIAFNGTHGIRITGGRNGEYVSGNAVRRNAIFGNAGIGIDVGADSTVTANDAGDADVGPNKLQNFPVITEARYSDGQNELTVTYRVPTDADNAAYPLDVEFFLADTDQHEGETYLGTDAYTTTDYTGGPEKTITFSPRASLTQGDVLVATATDADGNTSEFSAAVALLAVAIDLDPSQITAPYVGEPVDLSIAMPEGFQPQTNSFYYRPTGTADYERIELQPTGDGTVFAGTIPGDAVELRGIDFYAAFSDERYTITYPQTEPETRPAQLHTRFDTLSPPVAFAPDTYRMISIPAAVDEADLASVFADYGAYERDRWRVLRWDPEAEAYDELPDLDDVPATPGRAFWLVTRDGDSFTLDGGRSTDASEPHEMTLVPGWNQVGNPYAFPVRVADLDLPETVEAPVEFDGEEYRYEVDVLEPWAGYFVYNGGSDPVTVTIPPVEASETSGPAVRLAKSAAGFTMRLTAELVDGTLRDTENVIGLVAGADARRDRMDYAEAPPVGDHVRLSIVEGEERLAGSFKPTGHDGQWWDFEVTASVTEPLPTRKRVRIRLHEHGERPDGHRRYVIDRDAEKAVAVENGTFTVALDRDRPVRRLRVILGTPEFAEAHAEQASLDAYVNALAPNYPNPFTRTTTIPYQIEAPGRVVVEVYNMLGQRVKTLVDARQQAGAYEIQWDGRNAQGRAVASGAYFCRIRAGSYEATRKLVLVR